MNQLKEFQKSQTQKLYKKKVDQMESLRMT